MKITGARTNNQLFTIGVFEVIEIKEQHDCIIIYFQDGTRKKFFNHSVIEINYDRKV